MILNLKCHAVRHCEFNSHETVKKTLLTIMLFLVSTLIVLYNNYYCRHVFLFFCLFIALYFNLSLYCAYYIKYNYNYNYNF